MKNTHKTEWNLGLLYKNDNDPQIEKDLVTIEKAFAVFEKKYKGKDFISTPAKLAKALEDDEILSMTNEGHKPWSYFALKNQLNSDDSVASAKAIKFEQRLAVASNKITFFSLTVAKIPKADQKKFLQSPLIKPYAYLLKKTWELARYNLSEKEEQLSDLLSQTSYGMWVEGQTKILNQQTIEYKNEKIPVAKAVGMIPDLPKKERHELYGKLVEKIKSISHFAEAEINAVYNYKKVMDEKHGFKYPFSATVLGYQNKEESIKKFTELVTKNFSISKKFFKLHTKLLKENKLSFADRGVKIGNIEKKFDFETTVDIVRKTLGQVHQKYADIFDSYLTRGQIDIYPRTGKSGGGFCWGAGNLPVFILMNHTGNIESVETLAHEMGHAVHTELSRSQPERYKDYTIATAEVASTFFEQIAGDEIEKYLSEKDRVTMLHNKIKGDIHTIFAQIACFNFESELHASIREKGQLSKEEIARLMTKHMQSYLGDTFDLTEDDGYIFVRWSHIRNFFYVYSYAYGQLISRALYENWKADPSYATKIEKFLSAGGSMSPEDIFKKIGIDTSKPAFFEAGLKSIEKDIARLEKMTRIKK